MVFSSIFFIFSFLPCAILIYYIAPRRLKNTVILLASLIFYAWGEPVYILVMLFSATVDYISALLIYKFKENKKLPKLLITVSILTNLSILCFFKYSDFIINNINILLGMSMPLLNLKLPIGISFYTFQTMSYTIDVYRGKVLPQKNFITFGAYIALFPQLIAGPILQYKDIVDQLSNRQESVDEFAEGIKNFIIGLGKKVLIANNVGLLWSQIQKIQINEISILTAWLGIIAFALQIYFDFSGYSDMAIGLCKMFGFKILPNFNYPYTSKSITEFWRRWHISLGSWFREYVYIPLGGSKRGLVILIRNLFIVWFLTGLWHGASWNFIIWGLYFGVLITFEKLFLGKILENVNSIFARIYTIICILISWVLFSFEHILEGIEYIKVMFGLSINPLYDNQFIYYFYTNILLIILAIIGSTYLPKKIGKRFKFIAPAYLVLVMLLSIAYLVDASYNPFLYFRF